MKTESYIPYGRQSLSEQDIAAVVEVLRSNWLTQGPAVPAFEAAVAAYCDASYAVAVNSATSALHIACLALDVGPGDRVWTVPNTFVASANCVRYCGADVDFVDIDPLTANLCPQTLQDKLEIASRNGKLPKVVIPVHFAGQSCDMARIHALSQQYGFRIIEDASHAIGARYLDQPVGSTRYSDICVFSFHPVKIITTGEGGMALSNDPELDRRMRLLRSHGITRSEQEFEVTGEGPWHYEQQSLGYNYRMTDMQAALGLSQLKNLDDFVYKRNKIAEIYEELLKDLPIGRPFVASDCYSSFHLYVIQIDGECVQRNRAEVFSRLRGDGLGVNVHYQPVHLQPYYQRLGFKRGDFPLSEAHGRHAITLPIYPDLREEDILRIHQSLHHTLDLVSEKRI